MTTVAFDGEVIASDSRLTSGDFICSVSTPKIYKIGDSFVGVCGCSEQEMVYLRWFKDQTKPRPSPDSLKEFEAMVVRGNGKVYQSTELCEFVEIGYPYAIGSGGDYAIGAMMAGKSATDAVKIAIKIDPFSGGKVKSFKVK